MRKKSSAKQVDEMLKMYGRPVLYDRDIVIEICKRLIGGGDINKICSPVGMPTTPAFRGWCEDHKEAREIYRSACNLIDGRKLAKDLNLPPRLINGYEWEEEVRGKLARGWPADCHERKYVPPDWNKAYPLLGNPPLRPAEDRKAYDDLISAFTQMLEPRDVMELMWTKQAADATWEERRKAREKTALPEWKHQQRQLLDVAQSRAINRRDHAVRAIERWRAGLGASARRLPDQFVDEQALAECYGVDEFLARNIPTADDAKETPPTPAADYEAAQAPHPLAQAEEAPETAAPHASLGGEVAQEAVEATCSVADTDELAKAAAPLVHVDEVTETASPLAPAGQAPEAVLPPAPIGDAVESAGPAPAVDELANPARSRGLQ